MTAKEMPIEWNGMSFTHLDNKLVVNNVMEQERSNGGRLLSLLH